MRRIVFGPLLAGLFAALAASPAAAREDFCLNANGSMNKKATKGYRAIEKNRNAQLMRRLDGVWFSQTRNPLTGQMSYLWQYYEGRGAQSGLYSYCNIVCAQNDPNCAFGSRFQGVGLWAVQGRANNFSGMRIVSDLNLDHFCQIINGRVSNNNGVWFLPGGDQMTRVQPPAACPPLR